MSTKLKAGTATSGAVIDADTAGILELQSGSTPTTAITIDASQNVGIGTSSPSSKLVIEGGTSADQFRMGTGANYYKIGRESVSTGYLNFYGTQSSANGYVFGGIDGERMRIDSSGNLTVGGSTNGYLPRVTLQYGSGQAWGLGPISSAQNNFYVINGVATGVYLATGNTSWTANSDERLKTDLKPIKNAVDKVNQLRSVTGRYKTDEEGTSRSFLIAQDVQKVLPEAVNIQEDEIGTLGVQYTDVIPLLVASIKELNAKVTALEAQLGAK